MCILHFMYISIHTHTHSYIATDLNSYAEALTPKARHLEMDLSEVIRLR